MEGGLPPSMMNPTLNTMTTKTCDNCPGCLRPKTDEDYQGVWCCRCTTEMCDQCYSVSPIEGDDKCYCKRCAQVRLDEEEDCEVCDCKVAAEDHVGCCRDGDCPKKIENMCRFCATWDDETEQWRCEDCGAEADAEAFNSKYPNASCLRCSQKVTYATVMFCGGGGGACETWYCADCHAEGTHDCSVCKA